MTTTLIRLMENYDSAWAERLAEAQAKFRVLHTIPRALSADERTELVATQRAMQSASESRFRTTAEYRDYYVLYCEELLEREGILMPLPSLPDDCTKDQVDAIIDMVFKAIETTNSENF